MAKKTSAKEVEAVNEEMKGVVSLKDKITKASPEDTSKYFQTLFDNTIIHGVVVGVIQEINLNYAQKTIIIHSDGFTWNSFLPLVGEFDKEYGRNIVCLYQTILCIPFLSSMIPGIDYIKEIGSDKNVSKIRNLGKNCYFVFRLPELGIVNYQNCVGVWTIDECVSTISLNEDSYLMPEVGMEEKNEQN